MAKEAEPKLSDIDQSMLLTLYHRAMESQRPDALIKDEKALELVNRWSDEFEQVRQTRLNEGSKFVILLRNREFDLYTKDFLSRFPDAVVVHFGCGIDSRFERVDNGLVEWYDLDLPAIIDFRRRFLGGEGDRYHLITCDLRDPAWMDRVIKDQPKPFLFVAEGVFMYFTEDQVKDLILHLRDHFPGSELVFDAFTPLHVRQHNRFISKSEVLPRVNWGIWRPKEIERWGAGIKFLDQWKLLDSPEARKKHLGWNLLYDTFKILRIYHFRLGDER